MSALTCNCQKELEVKLTERFKENVPDARDHKVRLQGYGFVVGKEAIVARGYMPYRASATHPLKKGGEKEKSTVGNMFFSYCPFCGLKAGAA